MHGRVAASLSSAAFDPVVSVTEVDADPKRSLCVASWLQGLLYGQAKDFQLCRSVFETGEGKVGKCFEWI